MCRLLEEVLATCDTKMSGATVIWYKNQISQPLMPEKSGRFAPSILLVFRVVKTDLLIFTEVYFFLYFFLSSNVMHFFHISFAFLLHFFAFLTGLEFTDCPLVRD